MLAFYAKIFILIFNLFYEAYCDQIKCSHNDRYGDVGDKIWMSDDVCEICTCRKSGNYKCYKHNDCMFLRCSTGGIHDLYCCRNLSCYYNLDNQKIKTEYILYIIFWTVITIIFILICYLFYLIDLKKKIRSRFNQRPRTNFLRLRKINRVSDDMAKI